MIGEIDFEVDDEMIKVIRARILFMRTGWSPSRCMRVSLGVGWSQGYLYDLANLAVPMSVAENVWKVYPGGTVSVYSMDNPNMSDTNQRLEFFDNIVVELVRNARERRDRASRDAAEAATV